DHAVILQARDLGLAHDADVDVLLDPAHFTNRVHVLYERVEIGIFRTVATGHQAQRVAAGLLGMQRGVLNLFWREEAVNRAVGFVFGRLRAERAAFRAAASLDGDNRAGFDFTAAILGADLVRP